MGLTKKEAAELQQLAIKKSLVLMVGHTFIYNAAVQEVKRLIDSGELGDLYYVFSQRLNLARVRDDVNVLWNLAPHDISIILFHFNEMPKPEGAKGLTF